MKTFKKLLSEVAQPISDDEKNFKDKHLVQVSPHPVANDHQHTGDTPDGTANNRRKGKKAKRIADYEGNDDVHVYEGKISLDDEDLDKRFDREYKKEIKDKIIDEAEQLDELSPNTLGSYIKKASKDRGFAGIHAGAAAADSKDQKDNLKIMKKRTSGVERATDKLIKKANEEVELDEARGRMPSLGTIERGMNRKPADRDAGIAKGKKILSAMKTTLAKPGADQGKHANELNSHERKLTNVLSKHGIKRSDLDEAEQLDELSPSTLHNYVKKSVGQLSAKSRHLGDIENRSNISPSAQDVMKRHERKVKNRMGGIASATGRLAKKANEDVDLDEASRRPKAPKINDIVDPLKREREKNRAHDAAMGRTATGRKKAAPRMTSTQNSLSSIRKNAEKMAREAVELDEISLELARKVRGIGFDKMVAGTGKTQPDPVTGGKTMKYVPPTDQEKADALKGAKTAARASKAMGRAINKQRTGKYESAEQIDEISKSKLAAYVKDASHDAKVNALDWQAANKAGEHDPKYVRKNKNRALGINKAVDRLAKEDINLDEDIQLDEISKKTLGSYIKKSSAYGAGAASVVGATASKGNIDKSAARKLSNRLKGISKATDRLTKEDTNIEEDDAHFITKAAAAKKAGKKSFEIGGEKYPVKVKPHHAHKIVEENLDEITRSALKRPEKVTDSRGITRTKMTTTRPVNHDIDGAEKIHEETELDELSKTTLGNYVKKAANDMYTQGKKGERSAQKANKVDGIFKNASQARHRADARKADDRADKRETGIARAMNRLTKEETELSEISKKTLGSYVKKATAQLDKDWDDTKAGKPGMSNKKVINRFDGVYKARAKGANESVELDENFKVGALKLDDGSSVIVKKQDADLLNQMFKDLNSANRKKMQKVLMTDKAGFEEILGFAREAL